MKSVTGLIVRPLAAIALAALMFAPFGARAQTAAPDMVGSSAAPPGGTILTAIITKVGGGYTITMTAPCSPTPCKWGTRPLTIYAPSVVTRVGKVGSAVFAQGFVTRTVVVTLQDATAPFLQVQVLSKFAAGDTRSNSATIQTLH
jgi:hypothetical protein